MNGSLSLSHSPLSKPSEKDLYRLAQCLWSWQGCDDWQKHETCSSGECPGTRLRRLTRYFDYYRALVGAYEIDRNRKTGTALVTHGDLLNIISRLKAAPELTRAEHSQHIFTPFQGRSSIEETDQELVLNLAVRVSVMVNCSSRRPESSVLELGLFHAPWQQDVTYSQFIGNAFPQTDHPTINDDNISGNIDLKDAISATKLTKRAKLAFRPTDDLRCHLLLDRRTRTVEIYHHTAFLKEQLRATKSLDKNMSINDNLKFGVLPRQLLLEALDSVQKVLFPISDPKCYALLQSLTTKYSFDPDCLRFESSSIRNDDERDISYHYFGSRLAELYEELKTPAPHNSLEKWLERRSAPRYVMLATLLGVIIAILLGMLALAVSVAQVYISYQAWKHPVFQP